MLQKFLIWINNHQSLRNQVISIMQQPSASLWFHFVRKQLQQRGYIPSTVETDCYVINRRAWKQAWLKNPVLDTPQKFLSPLERLTSKLHGSESSLLTSAPPWWAAATSRTSAKCDTELAALVKCLCLGLCHLLPLIHALHTAVSSSQTSNHFMYTLSVN